MNKTKKAILSIGSIAAAAVPIATAISCGGKDDNGVITFPTATARPAVASPLVIPTGELGAWKTQIALDGSDHSEADKSFNQFAYEGMTDSTAVAKIKNASTPVTKPGGTTASDFVTMYDTAATKTLLVAPGFLHINPLKSTEGATAIDGKGVILLDGDVAAKNIASVYYKSEQSGYLAGVMAGYYLNENTATFGDGGLKVGTFGGLNIPTVVSYMGGFQQGIEYFNNNKPAGKNYKDIEFIDSGAKADYFSGGFAPGGGTDLANKLLDAGADLIFPVAGPQTEDVNDAITARSGSKTKIIGVDVAQEATFNNVVFSALKDLKQATIDEILTIAGQTVNDFTGGFGKLAIGTLDNKLVGVSDGSTAKSTTNKKPSADAKTFATSAAVKAAAKNMKLEFKY